MEYPPNFGILTQHNLRIKQLEKSLKPGRKRRDVKFPTKIALPVLLSFLCRVFNAECPLRSSRAGTESINDKLNIEWMPTARRPVPVAALTFWEIVGNGLLLQMPMACISSKGQLGFRP